MDDVVRHLRLALHLLARNGIEHIVVATDHGREQLAGDTAVAQLQAIAHLVVDVSKLLNQRDDDRLEHVGDEHHAVPFRTGGLDQLKAPFEHAAL